MINFDIYKIRIDLNQIHAYIHIIRRAIRLNTDNKRLDFDLMYHVLNNEVSPVEHRELTKVRVLIFC